MPPQGAREGSFGSEGQWKPHWGNREGNDVLSQVEAPSYTGCLNLRLTCLAVPEHA